MTICAVVYDFHRTLALPPGGTIWRRALLEALAEHRDHTDGEALGRVLNASFPWETPEERREHGSREVARAYFEQLLEAAAIAGGATPAEAQAAAAAAYASIIRLDNHVLYPETREVLSAVDAHMERRYHPGQ